MPQKTSIDVESRLYLSPPHMEDHERRLLQAAFDSNWIAPLGPFVDRFECRFSEKIGIPFALATNTGTSALHLALRALGVEPGDRVICPSLTFIATATPDPLPGGRTRLPGFRAELLESRREAPGGRARGGTPQQFTSESCDCCGCSRAERRLGPHFEVASRFEIPVIEDAAEALRRKLTGASPWEASDVCRHSRSTAIRSLRLRAAGCLSVGMTS